MKRRPQDLKLHILAGRTLWIFVLGLVTAAVSSGALAQSSRWEYKESVVDLLASGSSRIFFFETVGPDVEAAGGEIGKILFDGRRAGNRYEGLAHVYSAACGMRTFEVVGPVSADQRGVTVSGEAPVLDDSCDVAGTVDESLSFKLIETIPDQGDVGPTLTPELAVARAHLVDSASGAILLLDVDSARMITGELLDSEGHHIAQVTGSNPSPRLISLQFISIYDTDPSGAATYTRVEDSLDSTLETSKWMGPRFPSRWQRTTDTESVPFSFEECSDQCAIWPRGKIDENDLNFYEDFVNRTNWIEFHDDFTSPQPGTVCVELADDLSIEDLLSILKVAESDPDNYCSETQWTEDSGERKKNQQTIAVPIGLERWAVEQLNSIDGVISADYAFGPAGGSNLAAIPIPEGSLIPANFASEVSVEDLRKSWSESACKIRSIFKRDFQRVDVRRCANDDGTEDDGFCFSAVLEGHTSDPRGFASANLTPNIDDKFRVRSEVIFEVAQVRSRKSPSGFIERLDYAVKESKFARQPADASPAAGNYRTIEHYQIGRSDGDVDEEIFGVLQQLVMASSWECEDE